MKYTLVKAIITKFILFDYFPIVLNYLRTKTINLKEYNRIELIEIKEEFDYYAVEGIVKELETLLNVVELVSFSSSAKYSTCGTHKIEDLKTKDLNTGICVQSPYYITIELNYEHEFDKIEIGGWTGNSSYWASSNGSGAKISTSVDNVNFIEVGIIPSNFASTIITVDLKKSIGKYVKFQHTTYVGLGYFNVVKNNS